MRQEPVPVHIMKIMSYQEQARTGPRGNKKNNMFLVAN